MASTISNPQKSSRTLLAPPVPQFDLDTCRLLTMTDKRSPQSPALPTQKRSKTFPLAPDEDEINTPCRRATTLVAEKTSTQGDTSLGRQEVVQGEISTPDEKHGSTEDGPLGASLQSNQPDTEQQSPASPEPETQEAFRKTDDKLLDNDDDDLPVPQGDGSDRYSDGYVAPDCDDYGSDSGSFVQSENLDEELGRWKPPPEPLRPESPYSKGQSLEIKKHTACAPFGEDYPYYEGVRESASERELRGKTLVELCLDRPPFEGVTAVDQDPRSLEIVEQIRVKDDGGAQIVACRFADDEEEFVAKIYDPLYYGFADRMWSDRPRDVTYEADKDYSREVAAYAELDGELGGTDIPKYHGSWTFQLPLDVPDGRKMRDVRLILIERIKGRPMTDLKSDTFPESVGLDLVRRMIEAEVRVQFAGVRHGDVSQRNVMVCLTKSDKIERVALIDFNFAVVIRLDNYEQQFDGLKRKPKTKKPPNPIDMWWSGALFGVAGEWFPKSWELRMRACQEWLYENYGESKEYESPRVPLDWDEENLPQSWIAT